MAYKDPKSVGKIPKTSGKVHFVIMAFIRIMLVLAFLGAWYNQRWLVLFVAAFAFVITFIPRFLKKQYGISLPAEFEVMVILFIYGSLFFGEVRGFYDQFWWWDVLLNLGASIALGFVGLTILYVLYRDEVIDASPLIIAFFTFCFAFAMGGLWEIFEFSLDSLFGFNMQKTGLVDTMGDLIVDAIGAFLVSVGGYVYMKSGKKNIVSSLVIGFMERNPRLFKSRRNIESSSDKIKKIVEKGEGDRLEFKSTLRTNIHTNELDKRVEHSILKTIVAYLNSNGGTLLVGVSDKGEVTGLEKDNFPNNDQLNLYFTNLIKSHIGSEYLPFIQYELFSVDDKHVLKVDCDESDKRVFLKIGKDEEFYVRSGASSTRLEGSALIDYINHKFREK